MPTNLEVLVSDAIVSIYRSIVVIPKDVIDNLFLKYDKMAVQVT
jgi:hypothetical protein